MIRQEYIDQLKKTREGNPIWGSSAVRNAGPEIVRYLNKHPTIVSVLDFGCGTGMLGNYVRQHVTRDLCWYEYDPSVPGKDTIPTQDLFDLIITVDVMEHVEPQSVQETLQWIAEHSTRQFHHIDCNDTNHVLPDGRDVHLTIHAPSWWQSELDRQGWKIMYSAFISQRKRGRWPRVSCTFVYERC